MKMVATPWQNLPFCIDALLQIAPRRVLDLCVGTGRWGALTREFCDGGLAQASVSRRIHVAGIASSAAQITDSLATFYDRIYIGDAGILLAQLPGPWDVAILDGLLQDMDAAAGRRLLDTCVANCTYALVSTELGGAPGGRAPAPLAVWHAHEFLAYPLVRRALFEDHAGQPWGTFVLSRTDPCTLREALFSNSTRGFNALNTEMLPPELERVLLRLEYLQAELQHIKGSASYALARRLHASSAGNALHWLHTGNRDIVHVRALGTRNPASGGCEVWLLQACANAGQRYTPWDFVQRTRGWTLRPEPDSAFGQCLLADRGQLRVPADSDPELHFLRYPWGGQVEIAFRGQRQVIDLYAPRAERIAVYPGRTPMNVQVVELPRRRAAPFLAKPAPQAPTIVERSPQDDDAFIRSVRQSGARAVAVHCPRWLGVTSSTRALFEHTYAVPESPDLDPQRYDPARLERHARVLAATGVERIVFSGGDEIHLLLATLVRRVNPAVRCDVLWHGSYAHFSEDYNWRILKLWIDAVLGGRVHSIGTVKKGMERFLEGLGVRARLVLNYVPGEPQPAPPLDDAEYQLGLWVSGVNQLKLPNAMLAAIQMTPRSRLHAAGLDSRARAIVEYLKIPTAELREKPLPHAELLDEMRRTHLSLYVTFSECCPMLPLESLQVGVPCLIGPTSHLFEDNRLLFEHLVVPFPDRADVIADYIARALAKRSVIMDEYVHYAPSYNQRARESVDAFLA